uniref:G-protein coupled receptors family 1 profile domain-containing protein n=1 Tax=Sus scrofa TaxID=9823 RepID=A0A8D1NM51_PIG
MGITDHPELQAPLFGLFLLIYMISVVGNLGMVILTKVDARLQTPMYFFLRHLSLTDLGYSTTVGPKMLESFVVAQNTISYYFCALQLAFFLVFIISELFFCQQCPMTTMWPFFTLCSTLSSSGFNLISSLLIVLVSYLFILEAILRMNSAEGRHKAFSVSGSHLTVVTVFYGTLIFMYVQPESIHSFDTDKVASIFYTLIIPMLNPLIYSLRNKDVKYELQRMWKKLCNFFS